MENNDKVNDDLWVIVNISATDPNKELSLIHFKGTKEDAIKYIFDYLDDICLFRIEGEPEEIDEYKEDIELQKKGIINGVSDIGCYMQNYVCMKELIAFDRWTSYDRHFYLEKVEFNNNVSETIICEH